MSHKELGGVSVNVRSLVKNLSNVGRLNKVGKEARMVNAYDNSRLINNFIE